MIKKRFFIEGNEMDLGADIAFPLNLQCSKVASLEDVINNFTYSIKLPKTENNLSIIEQIQEVSNTSAYQCYYHDCTYFIDEIPLFDTYGRVRILRITDTIEVTVLFGNFTMFENLKLKKLKEGGNSTSMNDVLLWDYGLKANVSGNSGFGIGQFGSTVDYVPNLYPQRMLPWVSVKKLWDIVLDSNYNLSDTISDFLSGLVLLLTGKNSELTYLDDVSIELTRNSDIEVIHATVTGEQVIAISNMFNSCPITSDEYRLTFVDTLSRRCFIAPVEGFYLIDYYCLIWGYAGVTIFSSIKLQLVNFNDDSILVEIPYNLTTSHFTLSTKLSEGARFYIKIVFDVTLHPEGSGYDPNVYVQNGSSFNYSLDTTNADNKFDTTAFKLKYPINNNLPDVSQSDYIKSIMQLFGLMVQAIDGMYCFFSFNDVYDNLSKALDWSDNLVLASKHETFIDFASDTGMDLAMANYLRYKPDADITDQYGDDYLSSSNQFIPFRDILINQIFSASHPDTFTDMNSTVFNTIHADLFKTDNNANFVADKKINQRICIKDTETVKINMPSVFGEPVVDQDGNPIDISQDRDIYKFLDHDNGLDYTSLKHNYWNKYADIILNYKQVRLKFILTPIQIKDFRFDYPIYLNQYGRYFFVKKINNWDVNKVTEIDLIVL